jgi:hypothetical protein
LSLLRISFHGNKKDLIMQSSDARKDLLLQDYTNIGSLMVSVNDIRAFTDIPSEKHLSIRSPHQADEGAIEEFILLPEFLNKYNLLYFMPIMASFPIIRLSILEATLDIFSEF